MYVLRHRDCTNTSSGVTGLHLTKSDHTFNAFQTKFYKLASFSQADSNSLNLFVYYYFQSLYANNNMESTS